MRSKKNIFGSGTMRCGGSLHCNLISAHKDIIIATDNLHFFRHIYNKYNPIKKKSNLYKLSAELTIPENLEKLADENQTGLVMLKLVEIIGEDDVNDLDPETIYFLNRILNKLNLIKIRNNILREALPVKV